MQKNKPQNELLNTYLLNKKNIKWRPETTLKTGRNRKAKRVENK
jgi:hypothetical protein